MRANRILLSAILVAGGCGGPPPPTGTEPQPATDLETTPEPSEASGPLAILEAPVIFTVIEASTHDDPALESLIAPFRDRMGEEIREVLGESEGVLSKAWPEGTLGNFATDAMLWAANRVFDEPIEMALTNNGGLRVPIGPGSITMGQMYELMPFENMLSVLVLSGDQVRELCDQLAEKRGEPIAGFSFRIVTQGQRRVAQDVLVGGKEVDPKARYRLVTNDYMANGGDSFSALEAPLSRTDLPVLVRDAFIEYIREVRVLQPRLEGRITGGIGE
ncbi:MAG: 5'-nucleotidase C-terminal domain-containing protein [Gemmatimonadetes bacterium]|nr:5'-nucleotidase C-terminal domain-containing protein [Gemmatimonadota bacterium]NNM05250.1 5'-nucleotidase C-terminal domain-containing protein [Gemmatimonadota bacterium]